MRLKSFHGKTMADAMRQVREVLGDDAIIVATREEDGVGVRVTAAVEEDTNPTSSVGALRFGEEPAGPGILDKIAEVLARHGLSEDLAGEMLESIADLDTRDPIMAMSAALDASFGFQPLPDGRFLKPIMLVGPPGAGKTLAVAKLMTRAALKKCPVGIISTDTVRAGAMEQLGAFTRLLKQRLLTVEDALALADALEVQRGAEQVIIDTAGRNPYDAADMRDLRDLAFAADVEPVLVLPAGMDQMEAAEMAVAFRDIGVRRLLVTRLDMSRRLGSLLAAARAADLNFADASHTPKVADGLTPLTPTALARVLMPEAVTTEAEPAQPRRPMQTGTHS